MSTKQTKTRVGAELTEKRTINYGLSLLCSLHGNLLLLQGWNLVLSGSIEKTEMSKLSRTGLLRTLAVEVPLISTVKTSRTTPLEGF